MNELHLHDDLPVRHHHRHATEERLEILWEFLPSRVSWVHRDKVAHLTIQRGRCAVGELEGGLVVAHCVEYREYLLRRDREYFEIDPVEFVKAAPAA